MLELDKIYNMDCLEGMKLIDDKSIDMILCDLPYGTTACSWDSIIPLDKLWEQYKRIIKEMSAIVLTASQPFTSSLVMSNFKYFKYELIWDKTKGSNVFNVNKMPLKSHENILIFYKSQPTYNPQKAYGYNNYNKKGFRVNSKVYGIDDIKRKNKCIDGSRYPTSILRYSKDWQPQKQLHSAQKPVKLFEYLIKTYTNEDSVVLDNCMGSGTTAIACKRLNRRFIGFEINKEYYDISIQRLLNVPVRLETFVNKIT